LGGAAGLEVHAMTDAQLVILLAIIVLVVLLLGWRR